MATRRLPSSRAGAPNRTGNGSTLSVNELGLVRELMRDTRRQDGDGADQTELDGQRHEPRTDADAGDVIADLHCPRCRLTVASDGRRFPRSGCPRCASGLRSRPAPLFRSPLPSAFRALAGAGRDGAAARDAALG
ncbi:MAG: hypothetical protein M3N16_02895 [Actinomycetota bacterium]|nr:hypothetical protein [Actinomycetota bacterium]